MAERIRSNLNDYVADQIRSKIASGQYGPGAKLPNEFQLSEEYGVCRYTVREAVKKLTANGLVNVVRGRGTFVSEMGPSSYVQSVMDVMLLDNRSMVEIFEARMAIEGATARLAAQHATKPEVLHLRSLVDRMSDAMEQRDLELYNQLDLDYHTAIADLSRNKILKQVLLFLQDIIRHAMDESIVGAQKDRGSLDGHVNILMAIADQDAGRAENEMVAHLQFCQKLF